MPPKSATAFAQQPAAKMILREHLAQLESSLEETRGRVLSALDEELASIRQWMESLRDFDSNFSVYRPEAEAPVLVPVEKTGTQFKPSKPSNIVQLTAHDFAGLHEPVQEPALDPALEQATMEELNAALAAVFEHMGHK
ncbi:MAG TPA: hypothetical protein VLE43_20185 [Candidatus Saccharimonadia bacterium]|nr:hypothetical protein [Candidatus Saccharimonadia bacterium]